MSNPYMQPRVADDVWNRADVQEAARGVYGKMQDLVNGGKEQEARDFYLANQAKYNFSDDQFSGLAYKGNGSDGSKGFFSAGDINKWKNPNAQVQQERTNEVQNFNPFIPDRPAAPTMDAYQRSPYLDQMAQGITSQMNDNLSRNVLPSLRSGAMAAGGFGGSRQGVVESNALNDMNRSLGQNLTNLYGQDYTQDRQRALQRYQGDQSYGLGVGNLGLGSINSMNQNNLGMGQLALGNAQLDSNIYNNNFNNSLAAGRFGLDTFNTMNNLNTQGTNNATTQQNAPLNYFNNTSNNTMAAAGTGQPNQVAAQGNPWMAGAGAGLATYGAMQNLGIGGNRGYAGGNGTYEYQNPNNSNSPY